MHVIDLVHRWMGGLIGLVLVVLGASGALLSQKHLWVMLPHVHDAQVQETGALIAATERMMAIPGARGVVFAGPDFGLNQVGLKNDITAYATQSGVEVTRWSSKWERPEVWLFDLHHYLFSGDVGKNIAGIAGIAGLLFVISGAILWWRLRSTYEFRLWPRRMTRPAILRHHRDLGIVLAPLLAVTIFTGTTMVFRPVASLLTGPATEAVLQAAFQPPPPSRAKLSAKPDYRGIIETARARYPDAEIRILSLPRGDTGYISLRLRQPREWLPNGRTTLWFDASTSELAYARDALKLPKAAQVYNAHYAIHSGKVGGWAYRSVVTLSGVGLTVMGAFTLWTFWFRRKTKKPKLARASRTLR